MSVKAICVLTGAVNGQINFAQNGDKLEINGEVKGLTPGKHGFHVHEFGDTSNGCTSTGAHFNPLNQVHGDRTHDVRHVGDFGNIEAGSDGVAKISIVDHLASLTGQHSIIGRAVVVHQDADDLGLGGHELSKTTGNAGARISCGLIGLTK